MAHHHGHEHHGHAHGHAEGSHAPASFHRAFAVGVLLNAGFVVAEVIYGLAANSLSLIADAAHNFGDVLSLLVAWGAFWLSRLGPTGRRTYGYGRSSILASLINAVLLLMSAGAIALEAIKRFGDPQPISGSTVAWVALIGIGINAGTALLFMSGRKRDINIQGAFLHMAADAAVSLGVVVAAVVIGWTGWLWIDPATSLAIVAVIAAGTWGLLRDSVNLAMDAVPAGIDRREVEAWLGDLPGVSEIHDLHIWPLSTTETALTAHLVVTADAMGDALVARAVQGVRERFAIGHATFQLETNEAAQTCDLAPDHVV
jgi:cobalt-zinc-cadmium efflux system protein